MRNVLDKVVSDIRALIEQGRKMAYTTANQAAIMTYWNVGRRIVEEEQSGSARAEYGSQLIPMLAKELSNEYGSGYGKRNLAYYRKFYITFNDWEILHTRVQNLAPTSFLRVLFVSSAIVLSVLSLTCLVLCTR